jgi:hypothetical protein
MNQKRKIDKRTEENIKKIKLFLKNVHTFKRSNDGHTIDNAKR